MTATEIRTKAIFTGMTSEEVCAARVAHLFAAEHAPSDLIAKHRHNLAYLCTVELNRRAAAAYA